MAQIQMIEWLKGCNHKKIITMIVFLVFIINTSLKKAKMSKVYLNVYIFFY